MIMTERQAYEMFSDLWRLYKRYQEPIEDQRYWDSLVESAGELCRKYPVKLCEDIAISIVNELERRSKEKAAQRYANTI